jgi:predicted O-methyltransferase YrrM
MREVYEEYLSLVGGYGHPVSFETAQYMYNWCVRNSPTKILDMGSGFSSFVFREYFKHFQPAGYVMSVDTDLQWLNVTKNFLNNNKLYFGDLFLLDDFIIEPGTYDFVFHDIASADRRNELMPLAISALKSGGIIIFDDMQHLPHYHSALAYSDAMGVITTSLESITKDKIGRWALEGKKK